MPASWKISRDGDERWIYTGEETASSADTDGAERFQPQLRCTVKGRRIALAIWWLRITT